MSPLQKGRRNDSRDLCRHPEYAKIPFTVINENKNPEIADKYDYYYVPTFFTGDVKMMEGVPTKEAIEKAFAKALEEA